MCLIKEPPMVSKKYIAYRVYHLKRNPKKSLTTVQKLNHKHVHPRVISSSNLKITLVARPLLTPNCSIAVQVQTCCIHAILDAFNNAQADKELQNIGTEIVFVSDECSSTDKTAKITAIKISHRTSSATKGHDCKSSTLPLVSPFCV
jgi:hypothetical protein